MLNDGDGATSVIQTNDGGYALVGQTSNAGNPQGDYWLVKTDSKGQETWNQTFGGKGQNSPQCVVQTKDGGYAIVGLSMSQGDGIWMIKTDVSGKTTWNKTIVGYRYNPSPILTFGIDHASSLLQTGNGGFIIADDTPVNEGVSGLQQDGWLIRTDSNGQVVWNQTYGGHLSDYFSSIAATQNGGFILAGNTGSRGLGTPEANFWLVKVDSSGKLEWNQTYVGSGDSAAKSVLQTSDGGYAVAGFINSKDTTGYDFRLVKIDPQGKMVWDKTYGGSGTDVAESMVQTADGYVLAGSTTSFGYSYFADWLVKTDSAGNVLWNQTYTSMRGTTMFNSITKTSDGGFALAGLAEDHISGYLYLVKLGPATQTPTQTPTTGGGSRIPGFPYESIVLGIALVVALLWIRMHDKRLDKETETMSSITYRSAHVWGSVRVVDIPESIEFSIQV